MGCSRVQGRGSKDAHSIGHRAGFQQVWAGMNRVSVAHAVERAVGLLRRIKGWVNK